MYCCIRTAGLLLLLLLLGAAAESDESEISGGNRLLTYTSNGTARWGVEDGKINVVVWGGVHIESLGFSLDAEELRFNQATGKALVSGGVKFSAEGMSVRTDLVELNGEDGWISIPHPINGIMDDPAMVFKAGSGFITFEPGSDIKDISDIDFELSDGVMIRTGENHVLESEGFTFTGAIGQLSSSSPVEVKLMNDVIESEEGSIFPGISSAEFSAQKISVYIDSRGNITESTLEHVMLRSRNVSFEGETARIQSVGEDLAGNLHLMVRLEGSPIKGKIEQQTPFDLEALYVAAEVDDTGISEMELQGNIRLIYTDNEVTSDQIALDRREDGYHVMVPGTLRVSFSLDDVLTEEPLDKGSIEQWMSR